MQIVPPGKWFRNGPAIPFLPDIPFFRRKIRPRNRGGLGKLEEKFTERQTPRRSQLQ